MMSDTSKCRDVHPAEAGNRDGSESQDNEGLSTFSNFVRRDMATVDALVVSMTSSTNTTKLLGEAYDDEQEFNPDLPTNYGLKDQSALIKGRMVKALMKSDKVKSEETKEQSELKSNDRDNTIKEASRQYY